MVGQQQSFQKIALESWEVGGELLDVLSRGLYSDAKDAIREYVQNGVDAEASNVIVTVSGPRATIRDDGRGMDWDTLRGARRFGVSDKTPRLHVGYRGIGMYAAFGMCETLRIATHQAGSPELLQLHLHFGQMRRILQHDRNSDFRARIGLAGLLYEYADFSREPYTGDVFQDHFTLVSLDGISQEYRAQLNDFNSLHAYLLNTLPVAFAQEGYGSIVNGWLREYVSLNPIRLLVRVGNEPEIAVQPPPAEDIESPQYHWLTDDRDRRIAFVWHALTTQGQRISSPTGSDEGSGVSGYLLKMKGFTLGNRLRLKPLWPPVGGRTLYHHYTGEVHVLETAEVYPNAARDDLESSEEKQILLRHLDDYFVELNRRADLTRDILKTQRRMAGTDRTIADLQHRYAKLDQDPFELYRDSKNYLDDLDRTERDLFRLRRGSKAVKPTPAQQEQLEGLRAEIAAARKSVNAIVRATKQETEEDRGKPRRSTSAPPPRLALIIRARDAVQLMFGEGPSAELKRVQDRLALAARTGSVAQAVEVLDELKARGADLPDTLEASRKELRTHLGWSPAAPVSLEEALSESGFLPATEREQALIHAIDHALLNGLGSRGQQYETVLRAIAEGVADTDALR